MSTSENLEIILKLADRLPLSKRGGNGWTACCPFHTEKTPSFWVDIEKSFFHCFGCGVHGQLADLPARLELAH
jgi:DNA primase